MNKNQLFTIIVPVYNSELYLANCVNSILEQSYIYFELILINDGSTDGSGIMCASFAAKDNRIKVIQKQNGGQGSARNLALKVANGEYIMFVDSDDAIGPDTLMDNYNILKENLAIDCLQYPIYRNYGTNDAFIDKGKPALYSQEDDFKNLLLGKSVISWIVCDKIIKKEVLGNLYFPEDMVYEDNFFILDLIDRINNCYISEKGMYYYYHRDNSTTTSKFSLKSELSTSKVLAHTLNKLELPQENNLFFKYLIRFINVNKSLTVNFNSEAHNFQDYKKHVHIKDVINSKQNLKNKFKIVLYKYA